MVLCFKSLWSINEPHPESLLNSSIERLVSAGTSGNKSSPLAQEIMLNFVATSIAEGLSIYLLPYLSRLLKLTLATVTDTDRVRGRFKTTTKLGLFKDLVECAKRALALQSQLVFPSGTLLEIFVSTLLALIRSEDMTWHSRAILLSFLQYVSQVSSTLLTNGTPTQDLPLQSCFPPFGRTVLADSRDSHSQPRRPFH